MISTEVAAAMAQNSGPLATMQAVAQGWCFLRRERLGGEICEARLKVNNP